MIEVSFMNRKYRQRGYQDDPSEKKSAPPPKTQGPREFRPRAMPAFRETARCSMCGTTVTVAIGPGSQCLKCGADLYTCKQCRFFDTGLRNECSQPVPERIVRKDIRNQCQFFEAKLSIERETGSAEVSKAPPNPKNPNDARRAFDALFKK